MTMGTNDVSHKKTNALKGLVEKAIQGSSIKDCIKHKLTHFISQGICKNLNHFVDMGKMQCYVHDQDRRMLRWAFSS